MPSAAIPRMEKYARMARRGRTYERGSDCQKLEDFEVELLEIEAYWSNRSYNQKVRGLDTCPVKYDKTESQLKAFWKEGFSVFRDNLLFYTNRSINSEYITKISEFIQNVLIWFL